MEISRARRFMLLGAARTGSNLLCSLLSAHPAIKMYGELFNLDALPRESLIEALDDPGRYLRNRLDRGHPCPITAVGFKMFYDHLTKDYFDKLVDLSEASPELQDKFKRFAAFVDANYAWSTLAHRFDDLWSLLASDRSLAIVHLERRNKLNTLVSLKTAYLTRRWWTLKAGGESPTRLRLDPEECARYFSKLEAFATSADRAFAAHDRLSVAYEDLTAHQEDVLTRIFTFLQVPVEPVSTRMKKQILAPAAEIVTNYRELKARFSDTRWSVFFE